MDDGHPRIIKLVKFFGKPAAEVVGTVQRILPVHNIDGKFILLVISFFYYYYYFNNTLVLELSSYSSRGASREFSLFFRLFFNDMLLL